MPLTECLPYPTFYEVDNALLEIRDKRLYRAMHKTFEEYCRERWGMSRRNANYLISSTEVIGNLGTMGPNLPTSERVVRPLTSLPPEKQREAYQLIEAGKVMDNGRHGAHSPSIRARHSDPSLNALNDTHGCQCRAF